MPEVMDSRGDDTGRVHPQAIPGVTGTISLTEPSDSQRDVTDWNGWHPITRAEDGVSTVSGLNVPRRGAIPLPW